MTAEPHQVFGGRYELGEQIARGGTAQVFVARDLLLGRPVALKVLISELSSDSAFVARFRREAQAAANLSHPNIVPIFDWGEAESTYFIVMEYVDGEALSSIIRTQSPIPAPQAAGIASDIAKALAYAHRHGVVHRDVKPGNVLITADGQVKVTDFGIARAMGADEQVTQTGLVMGTATYFSPEQAQGFAVDGRSDIYSLGVVLYEMVTGKPPFSGESPVSIAYQHVRERPQPPSLVNPQVPAPLEAVILQAMAKSPADRYQSADAMRADLDRFVHGQPVLAPPAPDEPATVVVPAAVPESSFAGEETFAADGEERPKRTTPYWVASGGVFAVAIGLIIFFGGRSLGYFGGGSFVHVPNVVGMQESAAQSKLTAVGLVPAYREVRSSSSSTGKVLREVPSKGTMRRGGTVTLYVVGAPKTTGVPDVSGLTKSAAEKTLKQYGFKWSVKFHPITTAGEVPGNVIGQSPNGGVQKKPGSTVTIYVAKGYGTVKVPSSIVGESLQQAEAALEGTDLTPGKVTTRYTENTQQGIVLSASPAPGASVTAGTPVNLTVSGGGLDAVPEVLGEAIYVATANVSAKGLTPVVVPETTNDPGQVGTVIRQSPAAGVLLRPGRDVTLFEGTSPTTGATGSTTTTSTTPTQSSGPPTS
jgi:eukaryotic-like serine/threonine-protein kinase